MVTKFKIVLLKHKFLKKVLLDIVNCVRYITLHTKNKLQRRQPKKKQH